MQNSCTWSKSFEKSINENAQLIFSKKITVSTVNRKDNLSYSDILDIQEIHVIKPEISALICHMDNRSLIFKSLLRNSLVHLTNFFPLSREKYKMNCLAFLFSREKNIFFTDEDQLSNYLKINYLLSRSQGKLTNSIDEAEYMECARKYILSLIEEFISSNKSKEEILNSQWSRLGSEVKLDYETVDKDSIKQDNILKSYDKNIENFEAQEEIFYSQNFCVAMFIPLDVEHSIYPMPQVVANSRKPNFESLIKPHRKPKKFLLSYNFYDVLWSFNELNV